ncbi:hypothetical protein CBU02nite_36860 [Clostridium butyricum]|uniref:Transposase InsH N-terminal domain-containing protein n=1 Tax=Clostridium butyricum TaxID=1492 RepID=A0A512TSC2_CLOBU|nr:transposase [Clostridium butyricum]GEQ23180.1 hypothetical protein CBU02nite_36860 [Clostridium butyricum]
MNYIGTICELFCSSSLKLTTKANINSVLENLMPENDSVRLLSHVLEGLDYRKLYKAYSSVGRKSAVEPKIMFKIISYSYSQNIYSSRKI